MLSKEEGNLLLDFYGSLLTEHQLNVLNDYFVEDLSMNEIADELNISRAAVCDLINRSVKQLESYETKLNLISQDRKLDIIINELSNGDDYTKDIARRLLEIYRG
ncbi:MAG: YlxM family DNA-binding protein [Erysipelotrichaceae bacterium]